MASPTRWIVTGIEVVGRAGNGEEALKLARELQPDVIVLDMHMPDISGIGVLQKLREEQPEIRALALTGSGVLTTISWWPLAG